MSSTILAAAKAGTQSKHVPGALRPHEVSDFSLLVRVPGQPGACRVFTPDEADEAAEYARSSGGAVENLPR